MLGLCGVVMLKVTCAEHLLVDAGDGLDFGQFIALGPQRQQRALRVTELQEGLLESVFILGLLQQLFGVEAAACELDDVLVVFGGVGGRWRVSGAPL